MEFIGEVTCSIGVTDLKRSITWYAQTLGFALLYENEATAWAEMATPVSKTTVGLGQVETVPQGGGATLTWGVTDIVAAMAELESKDVKLDGDIVIIPGLVKLLTFYDPDGNAMMLFEMNNTTA